jgi:hypothetical protein
VGKRIVRWVSKQAREQASELVGGQAGCTGGAAKFKTFAPRGILQATNHLMALVKSRLCG